MAKTSYMCDLYLRQCKVASEKSIEEPEKLKRYLTILLDIKTNIENTKALYKDYLRNLRKTFVKYSEKYIEGKEPIILHNRQWFLDLIDAPYFEVGWLEQKDFTRERCDLILENHKKHLDMYLTILRYLGM